MCERLGGHQEDAELQESVGTHLGQGETSGRPHREGHLPRKPGRMSKHDPCPQRSVQAERTVQGGKAWPWEEGGQALAGSLGVRGA